MPIFDYSCQACGHHFDVLQKLGAEPLVDCPECGQPKLKKLLSAPAFHLKGKGWKNTDEAPKKPDVRPKFAHTLDSPVPHAEHTHDGPAKPAGHSHDHSHGHSHDHGKVEEKGGVAKIARDHVNKKTKDHSHDHGHSHGHSHGHKRDH